VLINIAGALDSFDSLARKLYDTSLPEETVKQIKLDMSRNINLMMANRNETLAEATRLYETVFLGGGELTTGRPSFQHPRHVDHSVRREPP
jgi:hypothetical protein